MQGRLPIVISLAAGLIAIVLLNFYVEGVRQEALPPATQVMVAARDLRQGRALEPADVAAASRFTQALPALHVKWAERNLYFGQPLAVPVRAGDYVLASYFGAETVAAQRLSERVDAKTNQRALTIPVTNEMSLEASVRPGDRIDLMLTYTQTETQRDKAGPVTTRRLVTTPLLENVYVLATGKYGSRAGSDYRTFTLLVDPEEAKLLIWARNLGDLGVLLRNPEDLRPTDRAYLAGDVEALAALGGPKIELKEILSSPDGNVRE